MDVVYEQLHGDLQQCGYYISLFPGSFEHEAGLKVLPLSLNPQGCMETYLEHSLLEEYTVFRLTYYKVHRLIREYFKMKRDAYSEVHLYVFEKNTMGEPILV